MSGYYPVTFLKLQQLLSISVDPVDCKVLVDVTVKIKDSAVDVEEALFECVPCVDVENGNVDNPDVVEALCPCVPWVDVENLSACVPWVDEVKMNSS